MKRICMIFVCWVAILAAGTSLKAQEATITLMPGWTWIGYPKTEALDLAMALGDFVPMEGDIIKSQYGFSQYQNGEWSGNVLQLGPSLGYQYFSNRTEIVVVSLSSTGSLPTVITSTPTDITTYGMTCGGEVTDSGNSGVLVRGVCWSTQQNPTINDPHTTDGYGMGSSPFGWICNPAEIEYKDLQSDTTMNGFLFRITNADIQCVRIANPNECGKRWSAHLQCENLKAQRNNHKRDGRY